MNHKNYPLMHGLWALFRTLKIKILLTKTPRNLKIPVNRNSKKNLSKWVKAQEVCSMECTVTLWLTDQRVLLVEVNSISSKITFTQQYHLILMSYHPWIHNLYTLMEANKKKHCNSIRNYQLKSMTLNSGILSLIMVRNHLWWPIRRQQIQVRKMSLALI